MVEFGGGVMRVVKSWCVMAGIVRARMELWKVGNAKTCAVADTTVPTVDRIQHRPWPAAYLSCSSFLSGYNESHFSFVPRVLLYVILVAFTTNVPLIYCYHNVKNLNHAQNTCST